MSKFRAIALAGIGLVALVYAAKSIRIGMINIGGRSRDFFVSFADSPLLFVFGVVFMTVLGIGAIAAARHLWKQDDGV